MGDGGWEPPEAGPDEPDVPVGGRGAGALELLDVLEVGGGGELRVGSGVLTGGTLTDGTLTDGRLTEGRGNDEESAGNAAIAVVAPDTPATTDATNSFPRLDTDCSLSCRF